MKKCIYQTADNYCELHSDGVEYREPCIEGPCGDEVFDATIDKFLEEDGE